MVDASKSKAEHNESKEVPVMSRFLVLGGVAVMVAALFTARLPAQHFGGHDGGHGGFGHEGGHGGGRMASVATPAKLAGERPEA